MNILKKISLKNLNLNKKRSVATIMGITLSTALMIGIGLLFSSLKETMITEIKNSNGSHHAIVYDLTKSEIEKIKNNDLVKEVKTVENIASAELKDLNYYNIVGFSKEHLSTLKVVKGRLPINQNEIVIYEPNQNSSSLKLNVKETLETGKFSEGCELIKDTKKIDVQVVGIVKNEAKITSICGETVITIQSDGAYSAYIEFNSIKDARYKTKVLVKSLGIEEPDSRIKFNTALLEVSGESKFDNFDAVVTSLMAVALTIISIGCTIVIYNSFAISIIERKRQFGLLNSIGATKKQIKKSVYFESLIIGTIGITLGTISAFLGIGIVIMIANHLLSGILITKFKLVAYPLYIIIPIVFMILVIIASSLIPALMASRLSPIDSIKMKDDIKIKAKKLKVNGLVKKIFGFEATIAFKNMKRNKRKYRITILALFVSITMFIVFSSYMDYMLKSENISGINKPYDVSMRYSADTKNSQKIKEAYQDKKYVSTSMRYVQLSLPNQSEIYNSDFKTAIGLDEKSEYKPSFILINTDQTTYEKILKKYNKKDGTSFVYNYFEMMNMGGSNLKLSSGKKITEMNNLNLSTEKNQSLKDNLKINIDAPVYINEKIEELVDLDAFNIYIIVSDSVYKSYTEDLNSKLLETVIDFEKYDSYMVNIYTKNHKEVSKEMKDLSVDLGVDIYVTDVKEEIGVLQKTMLLFKILLYGFVSLIAAIGVTSVFNTLNTSIILRRREFAMLRSVGLSPKGFNKMIIFETLIFASKSLLYSIPFSLLIVSRIHNSVSAVLSLESMIIPYKAIAISTIMVFIVVFSTIMYSTKTIKKANILESLKDENI